MSNQHTLISDDLVGFKSETILASSTKESKQLVIRTVIDPNDDNWITSEVVVIHKNKDRFITGNLAHAIEAYNEINVNTTFKPL